jgi:hypothetical protein
MPAGKTTHARNAVVNATLRNTPFMLPAALWVGLHYADPTVAGNQAERWRGLWAQADYSSTRPRMGRW